MTVTVINKSREKAPEKEVKSLLEYAMSEFELNPDCDLTVSFVDDREMEELHIQWMGEKGSTDVLSFPMDVPEGDEVETLGDIVISPKFAAQQALTVGHSKEREIYILAVHGFLHILGYDHARSSDEKTMFALQESIVVDWQEL